MATNEKARHRSTPRLSEQALASVNNVRGRALQELADSLAEFWTNAQGPRAERIKAQDLVPEFARFAGVLFDSYAEQYLLLFVNRTEYERFLRFELPEALVQEILPPKVSGELPQSTKPVTGLKKH
jgi:hypothetical protein